MPLEAWILAKVADKVFSYASDKGQNIVEKWVRDKLGLEPRKQAYKNALAKAYKKFEKRYPEWAADLFNASFLEKEGANVLARFLVQDGLPSPSELATLWADSLNLRNSERRTTLVRELEPAATDFLDYMTSALKGEEALSDLNDSRALDQIVSELKALRKKIDAEQATPGTRRDYLRWLAERNMYLDARGTLQTQRQVQVKLEEVYVSLRAQREDTSGTMDRHLLELEKELAELEAKEASLAAEEREDRREQLLARFESRLMNESPKVLELAEVVSRYDRLVILGDPGSGKTTLLRYLTLKHAHALWHGQTEAGTGLGFARFPILIRIAEYAEESTWKKQSLSEFLAESYSIHDCPRQGLTDLLQSELEKGNCLVLLDGLDEIVSADERRGVVERIEDFVRRHYNKANRFVITSRLAGYLSAPMAEPFTHYIVQEMDEMQIRHFLERWCQTVEDAQTPAISAQERKKVAQREIDGIMRAVHTSSGVRRLAANPLLLRILALIHRTGAQLPHKRIELYKLTADTLAYTWRASHGIPESALVKDEYLTPMLSKLAYWLHINKPTGIATEREVYHVLGEEWARLNELHWNADEPSPKITEEVRKFLLAVREHTGLFVERAPRRYSFMHLTFEEYYTARYLVARRKARTQLLRQHLHDPRWEEPILLALGFIGLDDTEAARELLETAVLAEGEEAKDLGLTSSPYEDLLGCDYLFALRCLGDNIPVRPRLLERLIERLANELLYRTGSAQFQRYQQTLEQRLENLKNSEAALQLSRILIAALDNTDIEIRRSAAIDLGQLGLATPKAISILIDTLLQQVDADTHSKAVVSLRQSGEEFHKVIETLVEAVQSASWSIRSQAAKSLGELGQAFPEVIKALIHAMHDVEPLVRKRAAESLGELGHASPDVLDVLTTALHDPYSSRVRSEAAKSLGELGQASPTVLEALTRSIGEPHSNVRRAAVESLSQLSQTSPVVMHIFVNIMSDVNHPGRFEVARSILESDRITFKQELVKTFTNALHNDIDPDIRSVIARNLGKFELITPEMLAAFINATSDTNSNVRSAAMKSLVRLGETFPDAITAIINVLYQDVDPSVRQAAAQDLGLVGQRSQIIVALSNALHQDPNPIIREAAAVSLARLNHITPEVLAALIEALDKSTDLPIRRDSARLLGQIGHSDEATIKVLWYGLLDSNPYVRAACAQALAQLGRRFPTAMQEIAAKLVQAIQDPMFNKPSSLVNDTGHDYAYDGLWLLVVGGEIEDGK